jgi:hypothetical protein
MGSIEKITYKDGTINVDGMVLKVEGGEAK